MISYIIILEIEHTTGSKVFHRTGMIIIWHSAVERKVWFFSILFYPKSISDWWGYNWRTTITSACQRKINKQIKKKRHANVALCHQRDLN